MHGRIVSLVGLGYVGLPAAVAFGIPLDWFYQDDLKEEPHPNWGVSPRAIAQFMGTEMFRDTVAKLLPSVENDFWIKRA